MLRESLMVSRKYFLPLAVFFAMPAAAASFDCGKAASLLEQTVCSDPKLSDADLLISRAFTAALAPLSGEGRDSLRMGQRSWLHYVQAVCSVDADTLASPQRERALECLRGEYLGRQEQLQQATVRAGHYFICQVDSFAVHRVSEVNGMLPGLHPGLAASSISYPQIDRPRDASQKAFNSRVVAWVKHANVSGDPAAVREDDFSDSYQVQYANMQLLSVLLVNTDRAHGAAQESTGVGILNWLFHQHRYLQTDDVFDHGKHWQPALKKLLAKALQDYDKTCRCLDLGSDQADNAITASLSASRWLIKKDGLALQFSSNELGGYAAGAPTIVVSWEKLKPWLAADSAISLPPR